MIVLIVLEVIHQHPSRFTCMIQIDPPIVCRLQDRLMLTDDQIGIIFLYLSTSYVDSEL